MTRSQSRQKETQVPRVVKKVISQLYDMTT